MSSPSETRTPLVTAVICNYNYGRYLAEAIESALAQTWGNLEIIVVDDGSTDDSRAVLDRYGNRVRVILKENGGQASAFNVALTAATGDIICLLDSDDIWHAEKVSCVVSRFSDPKIGMVCHQVENVDEFGKLIPDGTQGIWFTPELREGDLLPMIQREAYPFVFSPTSGISVRAEIIKRLMPLPEAGWRISADVLIAFGAICHSEVGVVWRKLVKYRYHDKNGFASLRFQKAQLSVYMLEIIVRRYFYVRSHLNRYGRDVRGEPLDCYQFVRSAVLIAHPRPWCALPSLWASNISSLFQQFSGSGLLKSLRYVIIDAAVVFAIQMDASAKYREMRRVFNDESDKMGAGVLPYLLSAGAFRRWRKSGSVPLAGHD